MWLVCHEVGNVAVVIYDEVDEDNIRLEWI
jgi:hypothetical protein